MSHRTTFPERLAISEQANQGATDPAIAAHLGCSVWTVRKWRRRAQHVGRAGLSTRLGRPPTGPLSTLAAELPAALRQLRHAHPGWGPTTLRLALQADPYWSTHRLPSRARIAAFLQQAGLTRRYQRHVDLPQPALQPAGAPHDEWQMDAEGVLTVAGVGKVSVINVVDVTSRLKVESCPRAGTSHLAAADYYLTLRRAFLTYGLPQRLSLDHDTVFYDNTTPSPFPTRLHLWLVGLGIDVVFIRKRRPTDHALIERTHQTLYHQTLEGQTWADEAHLWAGLDERREVLNTAVPVRVLANQAPLQAYPAAGTAPRPYQPEREAKVFDVERVYRYLAQGRWFRYNNHGSFQLGTQRYYADYRYDKQTLEITFDPQRVALVCRPEKGTEEIIVAAKGLTPTELMGEVGMLAALPTYQLALPWTVEARRQQELVELLDGTLS